MDLYGDLPPALGEEASGTGAGAGAGAPAASVAGGWARPAGPSLVPRGVHGGAGGGRGKPGITMQFKPRQTVAATAKPTASIANLTAKHNIQAPPEVLKQTPVVSQLAYTFEVENPYDPATPNDYIAYCQERLDAKKRIRLDEENRLELESRRREQQGVEKERAEALAAGDLGRVQASMGRGRGRGSVSNLPAWMTEGASLGRGNDSNQGNHSGQTEGPGERDQHADADGLEFAHTYMSRRGYEDGAGLGKAGQGMPQPISVTQGPGGQGRVSVAAGAGAGVGVGAGDGDGNITGAKRKVVGRFTNPSCVVLIKNMVAPGETRESSSRELLESEVRNECSSKYGPVRSCVIKDISDSHQALSPPEEECARCFVCFETQESAVKAFRDLNNRFFGGRQLTAGFFNEDKFEMLDLAPTPGEW
jgi:splicing factor 45